MWAPFFIVWRESFEALLIVGILYAWVRQKNNGQGLNQLWLGCALGVSLAVSLALAIQFAGNWYAGSGGEWFLTIMMAVAALLILQMVIWMQRHGRTMKRELEQAATMSQLSKNGYGLLALVALAVGREGSETVVFLTGTIQQSTSLTTFIIGSLLGFLLAILTFLALQFFSHIIPWKWFFRFSAVILLLLGGALLVAASDKIVGQIAIWEDLPEWAFAFMYDPLWDTSWLFADANGTWAGLIGYHAAPTLSQLIPLILYWVCALLFFVLSGDRLKLKASTHNI